MGVRDTKNILFDKMGRGGRGGSCGFTLGNESMFQPCSCGLSLLRHNPALQCCYTPKLLVNILFEVFIEIVNFRVESQYIKCKYIHNANIFTVLPIYL